MDCTERVIDPSLTLRVTCWVPVQPYDVVWSTPVPLIPLSKVSLVIRSFASYWYAKIWST
jgi:hypothetical protein